MGHRQCSVSEAGPLAERLGALFAAQRLAVFATATDGAPYCSLVAFAATDDLRHLLLATRRDSRKYRYLAANPRVSLLVDSRTHRPAGLHDATAVTAIGAAAEAPADRADAWAGLLVARHDELAEFLADSGCALIAVVVERYLVVSRFEDVIELDPRSLQ